MKDLEKSFIEWCEKLEKLRNEKMTLEDIPEEERDLFEKEEGYYTFNWDGIDCALFDKKDKYVTIPKCPIPECMREMFEIDEQGNPTGNYNWDYGIKIIEDVAGCNIHDIWNSEQEDKADEINNILSAMPDHMGNVLSNIDNASELYDALVAAQKADLNCPKEIRENKELIYELFEMADYGDIPSCFDLMSDELKNDKDFLARLFELEQVQNGDDIFDKINPELYKNDDEFKKKMIECWGLDLFVKDWKDSSYLWEESMKKMSDEKFFKSREYLDLEIMETTKPELAQKIYDEIDRRSKDKDKIEEEQEDFEEEKEEEWISQEERYDKINEEIKQLEFDINDLYHELDDSYDEKVRGEILSKLAPLETRLMQLQNEKELVEHDVKMEELGTSLPTMESEEIVQKYEELLAERIEMLKAEEDGKMRDKDQWELNRDLMDLIEGFAESSPELQERLMEEKQIASKDYYGDDKEEEAEFEDYTPEEIDAILEKEIKSKEARDSGFEINEFGEIIRPAKQPTSEELENMSEEELQKIIENNDKTIEHNNKALKKSLVDRILAQQKTISEQQQEIMKLNSQKKVL